MVTIIDCVNNVAGHNVCEYLRREYSFDDLIHATEESILDFSFDGDTDYIIVPSTHRSESKRRTLTVHVPGNWSAADMGGQPFTLNVSYGSKMKTTLMLIAELSQKRNFSGWSVTLEVDHHGPTLHHPVFFVEIGSTEDEWNDENAVRLIGDAIVRAIDDTTSYDNVVGYGGTHYAPRFTVRELDTGGPAYAHICPRYRFDEIDYRMFEQAIEKSVEPVVSVEIEKKGLLSAQKKKVKEWSASYGIECRVIH